MAEQYFMGLDGFIWFVGVVENRNDPAELGRVQVRCLGYHTEDLTLIPTADLPWAHVMHPVTDPSMQGLGNTPSFLVEGSWVVGFFRDAREKQQPVVMGTLPGYPQTEPNTAKGFNDPTGTYPNKNREFSGHSLDESDVSRLARGKESENHDALKLRRAMRQTDVPIAVAPYNSLTDNTQEEPPEDSRGFFSEPHPKGIESDANPYTSSAYPYNHVHESESGHIHEIDDSPGSERLLRQHSAGTFEEIHPDGSKVVKVVGDNYEIIAGSSNVAIFGDVNITTTGTVRELIKGDYHLEVEGDYTQKIHKNHRVKVGAGEGGGNREEEIKGNHAYQIGTGQVEGGPPPPDDGHVKARITGNIDTVIDKSEVRIINDTSSLSVKNAIKIAAIGPTYPDTLLPSGDITIAANNNLSTTTISGITSFKSGDKLNMKSADTMHIKSETTIDMDATTEVDVDSALINLN